MEFSRPWIALILLAVLTVIMFGRRRGPVLILVVVGLVIGVVSMFVMHVSHKALAWDVLVKSCTVGALAGLVAEIVGWPNKPKRKGRLPRIY